MVKKDILKKINLQKIEFFQLDSDMDFDMKELFILERSVGFMCLFVFEENYVINEFIILIIIFIVIVIIVIVLFIISNYLVNLN